MQWHCSILCSFFFETTMEDNTFQRLAKNDPTLTKLDWSHLENSDIKLLMKSILLRNKNLTKKQKN